MVALLNNFFLQRKKAVAKKSAAAFLKTPVRDLMTRYVVTVKPSMSVIQAATRMVAQDISCLIVVSEKDSQRPVGIVTERDFLKKVPASSSALKKSVNDIMSDSVVTVSPDLLLKDAHDVMRKNGFRKLVVAENNQLVGVITQTDIVSCADKLFTYFASSSPLVSYWMTKNLLFAKKGDSFQSIKKKMVDNNIGAILVKGKEFEGIFTEYDVVSQFYDQGGILQIKSPEDLMHPHIRCIDKDTALLKANKIMLEKNIRRLLVIHDNEVVGIITQTDLARALVFAANEMLDDVFMKKQDCVHSRTKEVANSCFIGDHLKVYE